MVGHSSTGAADFSVVSIPSVSSDEEEESVDSEEESVDSEEEESGTVGWSSASSLPPLLVAITIMITATTAMSNPKGPHFLSVADVPDLLLSSGSP